MISGIAGMMCKSLVSGPFLGTDNCELETQEERNMPISEAGHALLDATDDHNLDALAVIFHDDLQFTVNGANAINKAAALALNKAYFDAFSDWNFNFTEAKQIGNMMTLKFAVTGTHDGVLDLRPLGYDIQAPPTGKAIKLPESSAAITFDDNGLVTAMDLQQAEGASMMGLLAQLGVEPPAAG
jgi:hypothetical protein